MGGGGVSDAGGANWNIVPKIALLAEREPMWYGLAFDVYPSNLASSAEGAQTGTWWRTWGPLFYTYTYEDLDNSKTTVYMRRNLLRLGMSHRINRCDNKEPYVTFDEGAGFFMNRIRVLFGMNQGMNFKIYLGDELVGQAEEHAIGHPSMIFRSDPNGTNEGSSLLTSRDYNSKFDQWLLTNTEQAPWPYYVTNAATLMFAMSIVNHKGSKAQTPTATTIVPPHDLIAEKPSVFQTAALETPVTVDAIVKGEDHATQTDRSLVATLLP